MRTNNFFLKYQRYNKKKKPWRSLKWSACKNYRQERLKIWLVLLACLEAAVLIPHYGGTIIRRNPGLFSVRQETEVIEEPAWDADRSRKTGETSERGLLVDWKAGTIKLWRKVERIMLPEQD